MRNLERLNSSCLIWSMILLIVEESFKVERKEMFVKVGLEDGCCYAESPE